MACLLHSLLNRGRRYGAGPDLEFAALHYPPGSICLHFQYDPPRRRGCHESLSPGYPGSPSQFPRKHDPVRAVQFNRRFHAITMARSWRICKLPLPVSIHSRAEGRENGKATTGRIVREEPRRGGLRKDQLPRLGSASWRRIIPRVFCFEGFMSEEARGIGRGGNGVVPGSVAATGPGTDPPGLPAIRCAAAPNWPGGWVGGCGNRPRP